MSRTATSSATEKPRQAPQLDDAHLPLVEGFEAAQRAVELDHVEAGRRSRDEIRQALQRQRRRATTPLARVPPPRRVDQHPAHHLRRDGEEVRAICHDTRSLPASRR